MLSLKESATTLTISYPLWLGVLLLAMGAALVTYLVRGKAAPGKVFGVSAAALVCLIGATHFLGYKTTLTEEGARVYAPVRQDVRIAWAEVARMQVEERPSGRGGPSRYLVLYPTGGAEVAILLSGLNGEEMNRLMAFIKKRTV